MPPFPFDHSRSLNSPLLRCGLWLAKQSALLRIAVSMLLTGLLAGPAQAAYVQVYSTIQKGAVTFTGNTLELNGTAGASGTPGNAGTGGAFIAVGSPGKCGTFPVGTTCTWPNDASSAVLNVPIGATVLHAELIWSGTIGALTGAQINTPITFTTPSGSSYTITPSATTAGSSGTYYTRSADVTGFVQSGLSGTYTAGGVPAGSTAGTTDAAGWTLAVAYADPSKPPRNLTIFVGAEQAGAAPAAVSGFCTPVTGPVNGRLLVSAIEGDSTITGDTMLFGPTSTLAGKTLSGPNNLVNNFFASQINGDNGTLDTSGTFGTVNNVPPTGTNAARQGWDITNVDASPRLSNSQTTAYAQGTTTGDNYAISALAMQINVTSPVFPVTVKSVNKTSTFVGDTLRYAISLDNTAGNGAANGVTFYDTIPAGMALVANSVMVNGSLQPGADPGAGIPVGNIAAGTVLTVSFDVTVVTLPASPAPAKFDNSARWNYTYVACAGVLTLPGSVTTNAVSTPAPRLEPVKSVSPTGQLTNGQVASYTISVPNTGLIDTTGTTLADPIPAGTLYVPGSTTLNGVAVADVGGAMPFATAAQINSPGKAAGVIAVGASAVVQFQVTAQSGGTVKNVATIDPDGAGPSPGITASAVNSGLAGPGVSKTFSPASIGAGGITHLTVTLSNSNASAITGIAVTDNLPSGMTIANPANASTTCASGTVQATVGSAALTLSGASIAAGNSCTVSADVTVGTAGTFTNTIPAGAVTSNNAGVSAATSQSLTVTQPPTISKSFTPATSTANTKTTLSITLANPTATAMTAATFVDTLPAVAAGAPGNMKLFNNVVTNSCGGALTDGAGAALVAGSTSVKLSGGTIPANNVCTITVNVSAPTGGTYINTIAVGALSSSGGSNTAGTSASLQIATPQVSKSFAANTVAANTATAMTITLTNVTSAAINALAFTDTYPSNLVNSNTTVTNTGCGGTATASAIATNPGTLTLSAGTLAAGASCTLTVNVQSALTGTYTNTLPVGSVSSSIGSNATAASATLNVNSPSITKAFSAATTPLNGTATLVMTLTNPTALAMTGAAFTDNLPAGLTASAAGGTCVGTKTASAGTVSLTGGTIPANGSCTVSATVTGTTVGLKVNTIAMGDLTVTGPVAASNGTATTASIAVLSPPTVTKTFSVSPIVPMTGLSTIQIVLVNGNSVPLTGVGFTDTFPTSPGAMTLANTVTSNSCGGALANNLGGALAVGSAGVRLTGGSIPSNTSCTVTVNIQVNLAGDYTNTIVASPTAGAVTSNEAGGNTVAASAGLTVRLAAPTLTKAFSPNSITAGAPTTLTLTINNPSTTQTITAAALNDVFPSGMKVYSTPNLTNTCGGTINAGGAAGDGSIDLSGATIPFNAGGTGSCAVSVQITSTTLAASPGVTNTTGPVNSANADQGSAASAKLIVVPPPTPATITESFSPATIGSGDTSTLTFTISNSNAITLTNATFTDNLVNMSIASATVGGTCSGVTNTPALAVGATALNLRIPSLAPGSCTVTVVVTSSSVGVNPNSVSGVASTQAATGAPAGPVNLTVLAKPTISKAFGTPSISPGGTSTIVFTLGNANGSALTNATFSDSLTNMSISATSIAGTCTGVTNTPPLVVGATGTNALQLTVPSLPAGGCTVIVNVTSSVSGSNPNSVSGVATNETPSAGVGAGPVYLTVSGGTIAGTVYADTNHNSQRDGGEAGTGLTLYAKLVASGSPGGPAQQVVPVDPATGAYQFANTAAGSYSVLIDTNNNAAIVSPTAPPGWTPTEVPSLVRSNVVVGSNPLQNLNFGLFNGTPVTGTVYTDNGSGSGTANDGVRNGTEAGISGVTIRVTDNTGATVFDSTSTDAAGNYILYVPASANGSPLKVSVTDPTGYLNTGGSVGNSGGAYSRATGTTTFGYSSGTAYAGISFGVVPTNLLTPNGAQSAQPGTTLVYPHTFQAGSAGQVSFALTNTASPSNSGWSQVLYQDADCSGTLTATQPAVTGPFALTAGQKICLLVKQTVPAGIASGALNTTSLTANFTYSNASPALNTSLVATDVTTVTQANALTLAKAVNNVTQGGASGTTTNANPADILQYTLTATNNGTQALSTLVVNDVTPAFTTFQSASCPGSLPAGISACNVSAQPAVGGTGSMQWTFTGTLASGGQLIVTYRVKVDQ